jgi:hypothetical protein
MERVEVQSVVGGRKYVRRIRKSGLISSNEAATQLEITLRHLYNFVKSQKIIPVRRKGRFWFKWKDIKRLAQERR